VKFGEIKKLLIAPLALSVLFLLLATGENGDGMFDGGDRLHFGVASFISAVVAVLGFWIIRGPS